MGEVRACPEPGALTPMQIWIRGSEWVRGETSGQHKPRTSQKWGVKRG